MRAASSIAGKHSAREESYSPRRNGQTQREQRIVPQIQGPYYRNYYGGYRVLGFFRHPHGWHEWNKKKFYQGNHFTLDVF